MNSKPKISVIVPIYNLTRFLKVALQSVQDQTLQDFEVIVVNDGSSRPEEIRKIVSGFHFPRLKMIDHAENLGLSAARNTGLANAEGEYTAFLDGDDLFLSKKFEIQSGLLDRNPDFAMIYSDEYHIRDGEDRWAEKPIQFGEDSKAPSGWILDDFLKRSFIAVMTVMVRTRVLHDIGRFDTTLPYNEDDFLWYRIMIRHKVLFSDYVSGVRRLHETNMSGDREKMTRFQFQSFPRLKELHPAEIAERKHIIAKRARSIMKSYIKYCLKGIRAPKLSIIRDFMALTKTLLLAIHINFLPWIGNVQ